MKPLGALAARFSLRLRLTVLAAAAAAGVLTLGALLLYDGLFSAVDDAVTAELRVRASDVAAELEAHSAPALDGGLLTQVLTADGKVLAPERDTRVPGASELERVRSELVVDRAVDGVGARARLLIRRVSTSSGERLVVVAGSTASIKRAQERLQIVLGVAGPAMVLVVAGMAWLLTGAALRPVSRMTRRAATISLRDAHARLPQPPGRDEIAQLGTTLNRMLDRIAETLAHERAFVDDASHELRTPLAVLRSELELARLEIGESPDAARTVAAIDSALEETDRLIALTERLLVLARADAGHLVGEAEAVNLAEVARSVVSRVETRALTVDIRAVDVVVMTDAIALELLLTNLVTNASRWARNRVLVDATRAEAEVVLAVADDGPGFDPTVAGRAFDRFRRAGAARGRSAAGAGLGLAIVAAIAHALGGQVHASNGPPLGGARVEVRLPAVAEAAAAVGTR